ncbi:hypothetical protein ACFLZH_05805 [Patescibacteria group bacterium]
MPEKIIIGIVFIGLGIVFFFNNTSIAKSAFKFYKKLYTEKNLTIMFRALGVILVVGGLILIIFK